MDRPLSVLFLCTGNAGRSILAEALANRLGGGRVRAVSAGSRPKGAVNPHAVALLRQLGFDPGAFRSKSWDVFAAPGAPPLDLVITLCDNVAAEACPVWPGGPVTAHWSLPDPSAAGDEAAVAAAFADTARLLRPRIERLVALPLPSLDRASLQDAVGAIAD